MWPIHARTKDEYIELIHDCLESGNKGSLEQALSQAFDDYDGEEEFAAWLAGVAHGSDCPTAGTMLARFMERYPESWHPIQIDWAESLVQQGRIDEASNEARAWLSRVHRSGLPEQFQRDERVSYGVSRALLILTAAYTEIGARSYSKRILEFGLVLDLDPYWSRRFSMEHLRLSEELRDKRLHAADDKWETFFRTGEAAEDLVHACEKKAFKMLARRIETIGHAFRSDQQYQITEEEVFQLLYQTDKGAFVLH